jgi:hypothetical protein
VGSRVAGQTYETDLTKFLVILICITFSAAAQRATINGYIKDAATGESLIGATVMHEATLSGTTANVHGFYSFTLKPDTCTIIFSYVGYQPQRVTFRLRRDTTLNINLAGATQLDEVVVQATRGEEIQELTKMGSITITAEQIKSLPAFLGEVDVLKVLQLMPGVKSSEGSTGLYVRGGGPDQNLMLLDGVPVYNASHLFGFFSVFNADAINRVELIKGGFPARYGGRLSSVIDINMKDGNMKEFHGEGSIGIIAAKLALEGPIIKDKTSFLVSARRTYADVLAYPFIRAAPDDTRAGYFFHDFNGKINHIINQRNRLYFSTYWGDDKAYVRTRYELKDYNGVTIKSEEEGGLKWGNFITALRWNHVVSPRLFANVTGTFSKYHFNIFSEFSDTKTPPGTTEHFYAEYNSGIRDWAAKIDFDFIPTPNHYIRFGAQSIWHMFSPGAFATKSNVEPEVEVGARQVTANELSLYAEDEFRLGRSLKVNAGVHASSFLVEDRFYYSIQPRIATRLLVGKEFSLKASYASMTQYIHLLTNAGLGLPTDLWVPATSKVSPQQANQFALGAAKSYKSMYEFSVEAYYKKMHNLIEYREGASFINVQDDWQDNVVTGGIGESYGTEVLVQKKSGKVTGWVGYTLSWANRQFEELNFGRWYPYKYDRRHDVSVAMSHKWNKRMDFSAAWVFGTGNALTLPIAFYYGPQATYHGQQGQWFYEINHYGDRNSFRMRSYHRLDLSVSFTKEKKWGERKWTFAIYNTYNRRNPFYMDVGVVYDGPNNQPRPVFMQYSLFPVIPSVAYSFKF